MPASSSTIESVRSTNSTSDDLSVEQCSSREKLNLKSLKWSKEIQHTKIAEYHYYFFEFFQADNEVKQRPEYIVPDANYLVTGIEMKFDETANENYYLLHLSSSANPRIKAARYYPDSGRLSDRHDLNPLGEHSQLRRPNVLISLFKHFGITLLRDQECMLDTVVPRRQPGVQCA